MKLIIQNTRIVGTATDDYTGPDEYITAPGDFDAERLGEYRVIDGTLTLPPTPAPVPATCTRRQGRLALLQAGYLAAVEQSIATIADPVQRMAAQIEHEADTWERNNPFLQGMWAQLGGTPEQLDDLLRLAVTL